MNMSYCRFQNTVGDLDDCFDHIDEKLSPDEHRARLQLIKLARKIVQADEMGDVPQKSDED